MADASVIDERDSADALRCLDAAVLRVIRRAADTPSTPAPYEKER